MYPAIKRCIDIAAALTMGIIFLPLFLIISLFIFIRMGRPIFFQQQRIGYQNKPFTVYKFRTMTNKCDPTGQLLPDHQRLPKLGAFIRSCSLDELPQLLNIITGTMSFIGPRPFITDYLPLYNDEQKRRHNVIPGISGWAQVNGRNTLSWRDRFKYDLYYVDHQSFWLDIKIFWMTITKILKRDGIDEGDGVTMSRFDGNN